jgi:hypothetical protein
MENKKVSIISLSPSRSRNLTCPCKYNLAGSYKDASYKDADMQWPRFKSRIPNFSAFKM